VSGKGVTVFSVTFLQQGQIGSEVFRRKIQLENTDLLKWVGLPGVIPLLDSPQGLYLVPGLNWYNSLRAVQRCGLCCQRNDICRTWYMAQICYLSFAVFQALTLLQPDISLSHRIRSDICGTRNLVPRRWNPAHKHVPPDGLYMVGFRLYRKVLTKYKKTIIKSHLFG
jgi:hypothetical protein